MTFRPYDPARDREAVHRIWREAGWIDRSPEAQEMADLCIEQSRGVVAEVEGAAECLVLTSPATVRYLDEDLPMAAVTSVATSHIARKQGLGLRLTALGLARHAADGALVAGLGMFEQGYYDRLGFGTGSYQLRVAFDPTQLLVDARPRVPRRLAVADYEIIHATRLERWRRHGAVSIFAPSSTRCEMLGPGTPNGFGLGYCDGPGGTLSHLVWISAGNMERGPYHVRWLVYRSRDEFLELMALLKSLGDQVRLVTMAEPPGFQMQVLLNWPFKQRQITEGSPYASSIRAAAWCQMRICDLAGCLARTHLLGPAVRFNLHLGDPVVRYLEPDAPWRGVAGEYVVTLGAESGAEPGEDPALPTLTASVNSFTRLWLGVAPASGLAVTDDLAGPADLLAQLDQALRLPRPLPDWEF